MKTTSTLLHITLSLSFMVIVFESSCQVSWSSSLDRLQSIEQTPEIVSFYEGLFHRVGIVIVDSDERMTFTWTPDEIVFENGMDSNEVDFIVKLRNENISNLIDFSADGYYNEYEATRITAVLFSPFTKTTLMHQVLSAHLKHKASGMEDLMHVHLILPDSTVFHSYTIAYVPGQWLVMNGLEGSPHREFTLAYQPALDFHKAIFQATTENSRKGWFSFFKWYQTWKESYSLSYAD